MREIRFKGKSIKTGKWIYGNLVINKQIQNYQIIDETLYGKEVDKETIGQYAGLHDKNGKEIYEGDIVEYANKYQYIVCFGEYNQNLPNCAKAIVIGFYLKEIKTGEIEKLYSIDGIIAKFPAHCAESKEGIENFKLVKVV